MTAVEVIYHGGVPDGLRVSGHSGYAEEGHDVVCAAVSVLVQALDIGLESVLGLEVDSFVDSEQAVIELHWPRAGETEVRAVSETVIRTLKEIARSNESYVKFSEVSL